MTENLIALVMIVKNEARSIGETVRSARPFVDRYLVLDTGSTDGTQALAREAFGDVPGEIPEEPFVDFGTTRSRALELLGEQTVFSLMLSGDETLDGGLLLRTFCQQEREATGPEHDAYYLSVRMGGSRYDSARLTRTSAAWRYVGVTHEVLVKPGAPPPSIRVPCASIVHDTDHRDPKAQTRRWETDQRLLEGELLRRPGDTRAAFYLAQTLECLGKMKQAFPAYQRRVRMGGWGEEVYESLYRLGRVADAMGKPWSVSQQFYLDAHAHSPHRAEPLFAIAWHYFQAQTWPLAFLFASRGAQIPFPEQATLFVDADVYGTKFHDLIATAAYYLGAFEAGEASARRVLEAFPDDPRLLKNLSFYADRHGSRRV